MRDEALLRELLDHPATAGLIREVLGPKAALVAPDSWPRLVRALVERGVMPDVRVEKADGAD